MTRDEIQAEWDSFIEYPEGSGKLYVTTTSALIFAHTIAAMAAAAERKRIETSRPPRMSVSIERARQEEREVCIDIVALHGGSVEIEAAIRARSPT